MESFFSFIADGPRQRLLQNTKFLSLSKAELRSLKADLIKNRDLLLRVNNEILSIPDLLAMSYLERAPNDIRELRLKEAEYNKKRCINTIQQFSRTEINQIINKIEDP